MPSQKITDFLPERIQKLKVQGQVEASIWEKVNEKRQVMSLTWHELLEAMFRKFLEEGK